MKVIAGLGNPGEKYQGTKHNVGYDFIDAWRAAKGSPEVGIIFKDIDLFNTVLAMPLTATDINGEAIAFIKPHTGMNDSGKPIKAFLDLFDLTSKDLIVVYDDMDFEPGIFRFKGSSGDGKHNGIKSVIASVGKDFARVRVGIGKPPSKEQGIGYVLSKFDDRNKMDTVLKDLVPAVEFLLLNGLDKTMSKFNGSK